MLQNRSAASLKALLFACAILTLSSPDARIAQVAILMRPAAAHQRPCQRKHQHMFQVISRRVSGESPSFAAALQVHGRKGARKAERREEAPIMGLTVSSICIDRSTTGRGCFVFFFRLSLTHRKSGPDFQSCGCFEVAIVPGCSLRM